MIREIDDALRELVRSRALDGSDVEVVLDAPTTDWAARRNAPTVNLYLYDLREDTRWRERGLAPRVVDEAVRERVPPPRLFKLSYLVTAWTARPEDEHRLLDALLDVLLGQEVLTVPLPDGPVNARMTVGLPPPEDRGFADVWSSLGGQLKPSIDVVLTAAFRAGSALAAGPPVEQPLTLETVDRRDGGRNTARRHAPPPARAAEPADTERADPPPRRARNRTSTARGPT